MDDLPHNPIEELDERHGIVLDSANSTWVWMGLFIVVGAIIAFFVVPDGVAWYETAFYGAAVGGLSGLMVFCGRLLY